MFGVTIATAVNLSTSDHTHEKATYIVWYGVATLAVAMALVATIVIERRLARDADPVPRAQAAVNPRNATMNRLISRTFHEHRGRRSVIDALSTTERERILRETGERAAREIHDPTLRSLDGKSKAVARSESEEPAPNGQPQERRLVALYREGEQLRATVFWSALSIPGDMIRGAASQRQVEREQWARDWDRRVFDALADDARQKWTDAGVLPAHKLDYVTTIEGVREFLAMKLVCLRAIIAGSEVDQPETEVAEPPSLTAPVDAKQREQNRHAIKAGEELARLIFQAELQAEGPAKDGKIVAYQLMAWVEAWARPNSATEEVPKFSGDPGADLARLGVFVTKELARLRVEQRQA